jgi:hypothetical protein
VAPAAAPRNDSPGHAAEQWWREASGVIAARKPPPLRHGEFAPRRLWARAARSQVEAALDGVGWRWSLRLSRILDAWLLLEERSA